MLDDEEIEEQQKSIEDLKKEKNIESNAKAAKVAAKYAANAYAGPLGGKAVDIASKTKLGQDVLYTAGKGVDFVTRHSGLSGKALQGVINTANDTGITDIANNIVGKDGIKDKNANELLKDTGSELTKQKVLNNSKDKEQNQEHEKYLPNDDEVNNEVNTENNKKKKRPLLLIATTILLVSGGIFMIFIALFGPALGGLLDLTESIYKPTEKNRFVGTSSYYTEEEIRKGLLYVGDIRTLDMQRYIKSVDINYIATQQADYNWLTYEGRSLIKQKLDSDTSTVKFVVFALGLYDLNNVEKYINIYNSFASTYENVNFMFMSVNPVIDGQTRIINVNNNKIENFNNILSSKLGETYIDTFSEISNINSTDGVTYDSNTYNLINSIVVSFIKEHYRKGFSIGEYPNGTDGTRLLQAPIITAIGQENYDELNKSVKLAVSSTGICNKASASAASATLAVGLYQLGYRLPYYWGGGHDLHDIGGATAYVNYAGIDTKLGSYTSTSCSPTTCYSYYGYDCTGFVNWAVSIAMGKDVSTSLEGWFNRSAVISLSEAESGDIILTGGHAILVIENKGDYLQTLESTGGNNGLVFRQYDAGAISSMGGTIRSLTPYFEQVC